jgi:uncharacterized protein (DUF111 family)
LAFILTELLDKGALDVYYQPVTMKKSRLGTLITVICPPDQIHNCAAIIFRQTSTLGIRITENQRLQLQREIHQVMLPLGKARVKVAYRCGRVTIQPEYDDCAAIARHHQLPLNVVQDMVIAAYKASLAN